MMRRKALLALVPILLVLVVAAGMLVFEHFRGAWQLRSKLRDLGARGEALDLGRLVPPPPPPASNGIDRVLTAADRLAGSAYLNPASLRLAAPGRGIPASRLDSWEGTRGTNVTWSMVETWVAEHAADFEELQAALAQPFCRPVPDLSAGFYAPLPHLAKLKSAATSLSLLTAHFARRGDFDATLAALRSLIAVESVLAHEPTTISQLVRLATAGPALHRAWDVLHARPWTDEQLRQLQAALPATRFAEAMVYGLEGERALFLLSMNRFTARDLRGMIEGEMFEPPDDLASPRAIEGGAGGALARLGNLRFHLFLFGWGDQAKATYLDTMDRILSTGRAAVAAQSRSSFDANLDLDALLRPAGRRAALRTVYARSTTPALARSVNLGFSSDVHRDLLATDIALQRYHRRHGRYPESLDRVVPDFLSVVPVDAMDGRPLRYRLEPAGTFRLWSAGDDRHDDDGDPEPKGSELSYWWRAKDGVWPRPASEEEIQAWVQSDARQRAQRASRSSGQAPVQLSPEMLRRYGLTPPEPTPPKP